MFLKASVPEPSVQLATVTVGFSMVLPSRLLVDQLAFWQPSIPVPGIIA